MLGQAYTKGFRSIRFTPVIKDEKEKEAIPPSRENCEDERTEKKDERMSEGKATVKTMEVVDL